MAYGCASYEALYGSAQDTFKSRVASVLPPGSRLAAPDKLTAFGSLNHPLDTRVETTYGYNPLELSAYAEYRRAAAQNPKLLNALNASVILNPARGGGLRNPEMLPRAWFPRRVREVRERAESLAALPLLDPAEDAVVEGNATAAPTDARVLGIQTEADQWRVRYHASGGGLLALSLPYYPGWSATVGAASASLLRTDHALTGVAVPAGEGEVVLRFKSNYLAMGALLSLAGLCLCFGMILFQRRQEYQS